MSFIDSKRRNLFRLLGAVSVAATVLMSEIAAAPFAAGPWKLEVTVTPDKPVITVGEPTWLSFKVSNLTDEDLQVIVGGDYRNGLGRPNSFKLETKGSDGKVVPQPSVALEFGGMVGPQKIPAKGSYVFRLFTPHWATIESVGRYTISCGRKLAIMKATAGREWAHESTSTVDVEARTTLTVEPRNEARLGELIVNFGERLLRYDGSDEVGEAIQAMLSINDPRVIPFYIRALNSREYSLKFTALRGLAQYDTDEAFGGLKAGMQTKASDFDHATAQGAPQLAINIRHAAAVGLSVGKHPRAHEYLLEQRGDEGEAVRITVLHLLGKMPPAQALPLLREMSSDQSARVANEARRYIGLQLQREIDLQHVKQP